MTASAAAPWTIRKAEILGACCGLGVVFVSTASFEFRNRGMFFVSPVMVSASIAGVLAAILTSAKALGSHFPAIAQRNSIRASLIATALGAGILVFKTVWLKRRSFEGWSWRMPQAEDALLVLGLASVAVIFVGTLCGYLTTFVKQAISKPGDSDVATPPIGQRSWLWYLLGLSLLLLLSPAYSDFIPKAKPKPKPKRSETDSYKIEPVVAVEDESKRAASDLRPKPSASQRRAPASNRGSTKSPAESRPTPQLEVQPRPAVRQEPIPRPVIREATPKEKIEGFVRLHHHRIGLRDLDGFESDYAPWVDYFSTQRMPRDKIRADQATYQTKWSKTLSESVEGEIEVRFLRRDRYRARYLLKTYAEDYSGQFFEAMTQVDLELDLSGRAPQITAQNGKVISSRKARR